nr:histidine kinase [Paenibacillus sp. TCA20]
MDTFRRKTPEEILAVIQKQGRGRLHILIGAASGTGKTYHMLLEGRSLSEQGVHVVIGSMTASDRVETSQLMNGLDRVPGIIWSRGGTETEDLDVEAILCCRPEWVLVDELAHRNRPDAAARTRLEEVERLLKHGISVVTTVNVYELEGVQHTASQLTGIKAAEVLPGHVLEMADEVRLVDVTPEKLLSRVEQHKLRVDQHSSVVKEGNLSVLRELALRLVAEGVGESLIKLREEQGYTGPSRTGERILVSVQYHFNGSIYIRRGQQIARRLNGDLRIVTFVDPDRKRTKEEEAFRKAMIQLADKVGAKFEELPLRSRRMLPDQLVDYALRNGVTRIVMGHSKQSFIQELRQGSVVKEVLRKIRHVDLFLVADRADHDGERILPTKSLNTAGSSSLVEIKERHNRSIRGHFKLYIGAAPGVGKTYTMLREGNELLNSGLDVRIGLLETHGREETEAQTGQLPFIERKRIAYRGTELTEMDTEAIRREAPDVVLVDELAHTNVPGSRLRKRYEDVLEILEAGISVISTMNVQHLESLNDTVEHITGVKVRETVPDSILHLADEVQIVDVAPRALRKRMREGKIYALEKVDQALQHFFKEANLIALRELALRELADDVDERMEAWERNHSLRGPWRREEVIHVCVDAHEEAARLIRRGFRIAHRLKAVWYVNHVQFTDRGSSLHKEYEHRLDQLKLMTERLGGVFRVIQAGDRSQVPELLIQLANQDKATQIIAGQSRHHYRLMGSSRRRGVAHHLVRNARHIDLLIVAKDL